MRKKQGGSQRHREEMGNPTHLLLSNVELIRLFRAASSPLGLLKGWLANTAGLGFSFGAGELFDVRCRLPEDAAGGSGGV